MTNNPSNPNTDKINQKVKTNDFPEKIPNPQKNEKEKTLREELGDVAEKLDEAFDEIKDEIMLEVKKGANFGFKKIFRDIEIIRPDFLFLFLITVALTCIGGIILYYSGFLLEDNYIMAGSGIGLGGLIGIIFGSFIIDRVERKYPMIIFILLLTPLMAIFSILTQEVDLPILKIIVFAFDTFFIVILGLLLLKSFIEYTTMLERGRIISIIIAMDSLIAIILMNLISRGFLGLFPAVIPVIIAYYLYKNRSTEKTYTHFTILDDDIINPSKNRTRSQHLKEKLSRVRKNRDQKIIEKKEVRLKSKIEKTEIREQKRELRKEQNKAVIEPVVYFNQIRNRIKQDRTRDKYIKFILENTMLFKYIAVIFCSGIIVGLLIPANELSSYLLLTQSQNNLELMVFVPLFITIGAFLIGLVFDFYGRKATLSLIILAVALVNFFNLFQADQLNETQSLALLISVIFSLVLSIPLLNGDISKPEFYGRTCALTISTVGIGLILGVILKDRLLNNLILDILERYPELLDEFQLENIVNVNLEEILFYNYSISSLVFLACIIILFILANIQTEQSKEELNWPNKLFHMYIIHFSGLLLYEHSFKDEKDLATSDLVSGGLIGLVSILKEITKGKQNLRIIDHGDKKLLFQWDSKEQVVFVLVIERELTIIREKLSHFIVAFEKRFGHLLENFVGVDEDQWKDTEKLIKIYFTRKYLNLIPELNIFLEHQSEGEKTTENIQNRQ